MKIVAPLLNYFSIQEFPPEVRRTVATFYVGVFFSVTAHAFFAVIFFLAGPPFLFYFNIGSIILFLTGFFLVRKGYIILPFLLCIAEIDIHSALTTVLLGWDAAFAWYLLPASVTMFLLPSGNKFLKVAGPIFNAVLFIGLLVYTQLATIEPATEPWAVTVFRYHNMLGAFAVVNLVGFYYYQTAYKSERALEEQIEHVQSLKDKQDADYYLTSLLLKPLQIDGFSRPDLEVSFVTKQKKHFQFKNRDYEIGGDLSFADTITLQDKEYVVFYNADAMGKSLQGAGGAIVFGSVINARIDRSKHIASIQIQKPGTWLKKTYAELQNSFAVFEHSMLISAVVGLLDEETGRILMLNAEHPAPVLYRGGEARLVGTDCILTKIGSGQDLPGFKVISLQLQADDMLFLGSDGRDDIRTENGVLNADEQVFVNTVKSTHGDMDAIYQAISGSGEITDDLSLMRLWWKSDAVGGRSELQPAR